MDQTTIFLCEDSIAGICTGLYDASASRLGYRRLRLELNTGANDMELFCRYITVDPDPEKTSKVVRAIRQKISEQAWEYVYRAMLSAEATRADDIYRYLLTGFRFGASSLNRLADPAVHRLLELDRLVGNESHYFKEFLRFESIENDVLFARIRPKADVLTLVTPHFADRLPGENFLILDVGRGTAAVHPQNETWFLSSLAPENVNDLLSGHFDEYRDLWKTFYQSTAIQERRNYELQRSNMPLHYREFAPEFEKDVLR